MKYTLANEIMKNRMGFDHFVSALECRECSIRISNDKMINKLTRKPVQGKKGEACKFFHNICSFQGT